MRTRVKICGLTSVDAANTALLNGADALGFVFYEKSPRAISADAAAAIIKHLPPFATMVGLFVNAQPAFVEQVAHATGLNLLQFHGDETNAFCKRFGMPFIKAVRVKSAQCIQQAAKDYPDAKALLLDAYVEGVNGGTGQTFDWSLIPPDLAGRIIVAGGLTPANVASVVQQVRPYAVDVSGGVESQKGIKCNTKIAAFLNAVKQTDCKEVNNHE